MDSTSNLGRIYPEKYLNIDDIIISQVSSRFTCHLHRFHFFPFGPVLLTKTEIKDGCHACTGAIGVFYLEETGDRTSIRKGWPKAVSGWGWGTAASDWHITDKFTKYPAIYATGGYTGQGITESSATITELRPEGPVTSDIVHTGYTNEGAVVEGEGRVCTVDGKIANIRKGHSFDVIITGSVRAVDRYSKRNGKFSPASKVDWDMHCGTGD